MSQSLIGIRYLSAEQIAELIASGQHYKQEILAGTEFNVKPQKVVGLLFFENSTRTRVSFEQAAHYLGYRVSNFAASASSLSGLLSVSA